MNPAECYVSSHKYASHGAGPFRGATSDCESAQARASASSVLSGEEQVADAVICVFNSGK